MNKLLNRNETKRSMSERVFDVILSRILRLELKPYEQISEALFSEDLGVSRTPVREAFLKLASLGFLDIVPQRGTMVSPLRVHAYKKSQFMREAFELALVRRAVGLEDKTRLISALERELALQEVYSKIGDEASFFESDEAFHEAIAQNSGLPDLWPEVQRVKLHMDRYRHAAYFEDQTQTILDQHRKIAKAIELRKEDEAVEAMKKHLRRANHLFDDVVRKFPNYFEKKP